MDLLSNKNILVIGAHSDDEVLGVGGAILNAKNLGSKVDVLIVTDSSSVQYKDKAEKKNIRDKALDNCCNILGVDNVYQWSFPDMRLDTLSHVDINIKIEEFLTQGQYDTIFVHHRNDINMDHRVLFDCVMVAARPTPSQSVKSIYCYYTPSSSEWGAFDNNSIFSPNLFIDIEKNLSKKIEALSMYKDEVQPYPHPRSIENIVNTAKYFGSQVGLYAAEPFQIIRSVQN